VRCFVVVGSKARASGEFLLNDIPSTSGRLDVLLRALRAGLLVSHGVRRNARVYLVLHGGVDEAVTVRVDGAAAKYLRPDDRSLATLLKKALAVPADSDVFQTVRPGVSIARGGLDVALAELPGAALYVLDEAGSDVRAAGLQHAVDTPLVFVVGDHLGFEAATRDRLGALGASPLSVGPESLHSEDAIAVLHNELDRCGA
jgi:tRNA (pseudouridine54-N1)-methyltransferase